MAEGFKVMEIPADHPYHIVTGIGTVIPVIQETVNQPFIFRPEQIFRSMLRHVKMERPCQLKPIQAVCGRADIPVVIV